MLHPFLGGSYMKTVAKLYILNTYLHIISHLKSNELKHIHLNQMWVILIRIFDIDIFLKGSKAHDYLVFFLNKVPFAVEWS